MRKIEERVQRYWTQRAHDFGTVRKNELKDPISLRWLEEIERFFPEDRKLDILDAGTGTGYFAVLLSMRGHRLTGIDLTEAMLDEAEEAARENGVSARFMLMDAQYTKFEAESFDAIISRNLTWTLSEPERAYREWYRLLRKGGVLLNFDADYAQNVRNRNQKNSCISKEGVYGHIGVTKELSRENAEITLSMPASSFKRPEWDMNTAKAIGFSSCGASETAGKTILREHDLSDAPMFLFWAKK